MKTLTTLLCTIGVLISIQSIAQSFTNGDLNGSVGFVSVPTSWTQVPDTDPACNADSGPSATVDIINSTGPSLGGGVAGIPHSGTTFCSGLHADNGGGGLLWHEGIMQTVGGFTIGNTYAISFYQTVVKQNNCIDQSGSWRVYLDGTLLTTTAVSTSTLAPGDINLVWDNRIINFTATATSHTIKFLPWDDDANLINSGADVTGGLRMGIDLITFTTPLPIELISFKGERKSDKVTLTWSTATEENNDYFIIERSPDGKSWEEIQIKDAVGNSTALVEYGLIDTDAPSGINYYRLKQKDVDGRTTISDIISVLDHDANSISVYPSPANHVFHVNSANAISRIELLDLSGRVVNDTKVNPMLKASVDVSDVKSGTYLVRVTTNMSVYLRQIRIN